MKYLLENSEYEKEQTLKEICLDLTDVGLDIKFDNTNQMHVLTINKYIFSGEGDFSPQGTKINIQIEVDDNIKETILRIIDYLGDSFVKIFAKVNFSAYGYDYIPGVGRGNLCLSTSTLSYHFATLNTFFGAISHDKINYIYIYYK